MPHSRTRHKSQLRRGQVFNRWTLEESLGSGGNGEVWEANSTDGTAGAIKLLHPGRTPKPYKRFKDEITVLLQYPSLPGVLPIIDYDLPTYSKRARPWYVMPVAEPLATHLKRASAEGIASVFVSLGRYLATIHEKGISHRDIKPANLFFYDGEPCFGDWGLVDYPDKEDVTIRFESVGPRWTRAPEMERDAKDAAGPPADVYSLAKSLWILLTGQSTGFEGQYSSSGTLAISDYHRLNFSDPLDDLLARATSHDPNQRPSAAEFANELDGWIVANGDWRRYNPLQWKRVLGSLFPVGTPARAVWNSPEEIVAVLNRAASYPSLNHLFLHPTGGQDLKGARLGREPGTIELDLGFSHLILPRRLYFESFRYGAEWNYFRLESDPLTKVLARDNDWGPYERLVELESGELIDFYDWDTFVDGEVTSYRHIARHVQGGAFVIFQKKSTYNRISATYDGRHNTMSAGKFRKYIALMARVASQVAASKD
jgi:hypothetical protein